MQYTTMKTNLIRLKVVQNNNINRLCGHIFLLLLFGFIPSWTESRPNIDSPESDTVEMPTTKMELPAYYLMPSENDGEEKTYVYMDRSSKEPDEKWKMWKIHIDLESTIETNNHLHAKLVVKQDIQRNITRTVCLATQSTLNWLHHLVEVAFNWRGPMSVAVHVPGTEFTQAKILLWLLYRCTDIGSSEIVFRFVFPLKDPPIDYPDLWKGITSSNCSDIPAAVKTLNFTKEYFNYPQNMMRNIARDSCNTTFTMLSDNDMVPTPGLATKLAPLLNQKKSCTKCAFVVPVYEVSKSVTDLPKNKTQLLKLIKQKLAQPFHWDTWRKNQGSHKPRDWEKLPPVEKLHVGYPVLKYGYAYEPIYISKDAPSFAERFKGYGFTRNSQVFNMIVKGYRFFVLDPVFLSHRGFKTVNSNPTWRNEENERNFDIFCDYAVERLKGKGIDKALSYLKSSRNYEFKRQLIDNIVKNIDNFSRYNHK